MPLAEEYRSVMSGTLKALAYQAIPVVQVCAPEMDVLLGGPENMPIYRQCACASVQAAAIMLVACASLSTSCVAPELQYCATASGHPSSKLSTESKSESSAGTAAPPSCCVDSVSFWLCLRSQLGRRAPPYSSLLPKLQCSSQFDFGVKAIYRNFPEDHVSISNRLAHWQSSKPGATDFALVRARMEDTHMETEDKAAESVHMPSPPKIKVNRQLASVKAQASRRLQPGHSIEQGFLRDALRSVGLAFVATRLRRDKTAMDPFSDTFRTTESGKICAVQETEYAVSPNTPLLSTAIEENGWNRAQNRIDELLLELHDISSHRLYQQWPLQRLSGSCILPEDHTLGPPEPAASSAAAFQAEMTHNHSRAPDYSLARAAQVPTLMDSWAWAAVQMSRNPKSHSNQLCTERLDVFTASSESSCQLSPALIRIESVRAERPHEGLRDLNYKDAILLSSIVQVVRRWAALSIGGSHSAGVAGDGECYTWGRNDKGQLGVAAGLPKDVPAKMDILRGWDVRAIACGWAQLLLTLHSHHVLCV
ncbi:hypothetical protein MMC29_000578 [Sticta canariensis]|nr:hypothetical protein [Sticta canariensis]